MNRFLSRLGLVALTLTFALSVTLPSQAWAEGEDDTPESGEATESTEDQWEEQDGLYSIREGSEPNIVQAQAACLVDDSGNTLYAYNADAEMPMASITKIMTAMVAYDSGIPLDTKCSFKVDQYQDDAQLVGLADGDKITLGDLITVTLVYSGNDTASNIAYAVSGSEQEFANLMNKKASELGMEHTHFDNPHGLNSKTHYSCAEDLCKMGRYAMENYPGIRAAVRTPAVVLVKNGSDVRVTANTYDIPETQKKDNYQEIVFESTDELMEVYDGLRGIKTGRVESGCSFLGSARRGDVTLYSCVLNCDDPDVRFQESANLLDWGFDCYDERLLASPKWATRVSSWQDGFWLKCPVLATREVKGHTLPNQDVTYKSVNLKPNTLVGSGQPTSSTTWNQGDRPVGSVSYQSGQFHARLRAWNPVALPLFEKVEGTKS